MNLRFSLCLLWLASRWAATGVAAEPEVAARELPRLAPTAPELAAATFRVKPGFQLELVAAEPLVVDPIAMSFDEDGRLYVVEMRDYSERRPERLGRIRRLEDTDGDGRFDKSTVFADNLPWPTAVVCSRGGVFVGATPDLLFFKDTDGDGVADVRELVFTGFASDYAPYETNRLNVQALFNSFTWGLDNRFHGATSLSGGRITSPRTPGAAPLELRGRDFAFDPWRGTIEAESGGGQYGLSFDDSGRKFICSNSSHIRTDLFEERYAARNPFFAAPGAAVDIAVDGPAAEVYRVSPDEAWRVLRTKWRVAGQVPGPVEGGGRPSGYFTGATGITIYRGNAWPAEFRGDAFVADCGSNLIHRKKLRPDGVSLLAERPADEQRVEFVASTDNWFRPVQFANAPDGTLYVADMYREIIEHPWSLPDSIKRHLDLNRGNDRGRIYRLVPDGFQQPPPPRLGRASTKVLVATLAHPNGWHRDTAARLLYERQDRTAVPALTELLTDSKSPLGRLHALHALDGLPALTEAHLLTALDDGDARVREHAVRLSEGAMREFKRRTEPAVFHPALWQKLLGLASDPDARVRYQLAFTVGEAWYPGTLDALAEIARRDLASSWAQAAVLSSLTQDAGNMFTRLVSDTRVRATPAGHDFLRQLALLTGAQNHADELKRVLARLAKLTEPELKFSLVSALDEGLHRVRSSLAQADTAGQLRSVEAQAATTALDAGQPETLRTAAVQLLGSAASADASATLTALLTPATSPVLQLAAVTALARRSEDRVGELLVQHWPGLTPRVRSEALTALLARPERVAALLGALETGAILPAELAATQLTFLQAHRDPDLRARARVLFNRSTPTARLDVVKQFLPALSLPGRPEQGRATYLSRCAACHRLAGQGYALGPDLASVQSSGREKMLINILDPNREVPPSYVNYVVETRAGESVLGLIANETATSLTLRRANGDESTVFRADLKQIQSLGQSVMPEGLEAGLSAQDMADLLEYLTVAGQPPPR